MDFDLTAPTADPRPMGIPELTHGRLIGRTEAQQAA